MQMYELIIMLVQQPLTSVPGESLNWLSIKRRREVPYARSIDSKALRAISTRDNHFSVGLITKCQL